MAKGPGGRKANESETLEAWGGEWATRDVPVSITTTLCPNTGAKVGCDVFRCHLFPLSGWSGRS